jgi:hypothetical protein
MPKKSSKSFTGLTDKIEKAVEEFTAAAKSNTILCIMCNRSEYRAFTSMRKELPEELECQHIVRLVNALISNKELFDHVFSVVDPANRFYKRQAKKKAQQTQEKR